MATLGQVIRTARERLGWSQDRLAKEVGVSRAAVGQWENDETAPKRALAPKVARALNIALGAIDPRAPQGVVNLDNATSGRTIPIISWEGFMRGERVRGEASVISVDPDVPADAVAMRVIDDAMAPAIVAGELIVVSRGLQPHPQDIVVAQVDGGPLLLRSYVPRGNDRAGHPVFDLLSTGADWPTITCNSANGGKVLGVVVSHIRKLRR